MDVLVSQHFVGDPVEDVEYEEAQGKNGSGYGVNALGLVHKTLVKYFSIVHRYWRRGGEHTGPFHSGTILVLQAVTQSVATEVKTPALSDQFLLLWSQAEEKKIGLLLSARINLQLFYITFQIAKCFWGWLHKRSAESNTKKTSDKRGMVHH